MKVVKFEALRIEGFSSIAVDTTVELSGAGITMIKGENGVGKTTMFSALAWCLYGINLKGVVNDKIQSWPHIRTEAYRGTRVAIKLKDGNGKSYFIARTLNFTGKTFEVRKASGVCIFEQTDEGFQLIPDHPQHIKDCNAWIEELLGMNSQLFLNSVLFGQRMKRLVESSGEEKRALFEGIFNLDFIGALKANADARAKQLNLFLSEVDRDIEVMTGRKQSKLDELDRVQKSLDEFDSSKKAICQTRKEDINNLNDDLNDLVDSLTALQAEAQEAITAKKRAEEIDKEVDKLTEELSAITIERHKIRQDIDELKNKILDKQEYVSDLNRDIKKYGDAVNSSNAEIESLNKSLEEIKTTCTVCGAPVKPEKLKEAKNNIKTQIKDLETTVKVMLDKLPQLVESKDAAELELEDMRKGMTAHTTKLNQYDADPIILKRQELTAEKHSLKTSADFDQKIEDVKSQIQGIQSKLVTAKALLKAAEDMEPPVYDTDAIHAAIKQVEVDLAEMEPKAAAWRAELEKVTFWQKACSASGIKSYVFTAMFSLLNEAVVKYASRLGIMVTFDIDTTKASKPFVTKCYMNGNLVDYEELSGGQKQRVDIALAFATHDVVSVNTNLSLLIMDEVFEGLDSSGIETAFDLIRVKAGDKKKVFVITHSNEIDGLGTKSIMLKLNKWGYTEIES